MARWYGRETLTRYLELLTWTFLHLDLVYFKNPESRVIVLGAETAKAIVTKLPGRAVKVADSTIQLVEVLTETFKGFELVKADKYDLSQDFESQSIKPGSFDLVVAPVNARDNLINLRKLLSPGGRAIIKPKVLLNSHDYANVGFSLDAIILENDSAVMVRAVNARHNGTTYTNGAAAHTIHLVYRQSPLAIMTGLQSALEAKGYPVFSPGIADQMRVGSNIIFLANFEEPLLSSIAELEFLSL
jgi:hypothetical protein